KKYKPNFEEIVKLESRGLCITALGINNDYCSRFFAPKYGVNEDFVTATSHKYLSVYWSNKLNTNRVKGIQYSQSYGEVIANVSSKFIELEGNCCIFSKSEVFL
ncbi:MAG: PhzF family phenazine biosynthesis protein, partial [Flavobacterium sp.]|uniref:PhzF family phenazine biosynthesis protein n=1 Tax=Flavobacterium sp. TaxID=239 RepID=UPI003D11B982